MSIDPRKRISEEFLSGAPGCSDCVEQCLLDGHYYKSIFAARRSLDDTLTQEDREFVNEALRTYAAILLHQNFWNLAHLSKRRSIHEFDPYLANAVYRISTNVDELRAILYLDSYNTKV